MENRAVGPIQNMTLARRVWQGTKRVARTVRDPLKFSFPGLVSIPLYIQARLEASIPLLRHTAPGAYKENAFTNLYGFTTTWGLWAGFEMACDRAIRKGISPAKASLAYLLTAGSGIFGAKALFFAQFLESTANAGGTWYGGALAGITSLAIFAKLAPIIDIGVGRLLSVTKPTSWLGRQGSKLRSSPNISVAKLLDAITPGGLVGLGIGRLGCWSAGCCPGELFGLQTEPMMAVADVALGITMANYDNNQKQDGKTFVVGSMIYAGIRFLNEFTRHEPQVLGQLTLSQLVALGFMAMGGVGLSYLAKTTLDESAPLVTKPAEAVKLTPGQKWWLRFTELAFPGTQTILNLARFLYATGVWVYSKILWVYSKITGQNQAT
ncbi:hypothetical protein COT42_02870 [Candidatus Saganbacteria bacterium CG08_land_8_20_14_0_20_45_16]|uniref:Diacylglyceryl transferase n=1 Tax=Candidatus Saganbacteria bacterium CG08_land_8_20_14_0_20_45_16 TaxID=2014293 RepID=A0A2H0XZG1_UNCSA|nr:MAG: hypothetical protein COT42_02870 [Candidatus Saganbacteria bacterium CG08_land_8_20_14_0_20_45_16]